jgi:fumarate reductase subunit C
MGRIKTQLYFAFLIAVHIITQIIDLALMLKHTVTEFKHLPFKMSLQIWHIRPRDPGSRP